MLPVQGFKVEGRYTPWELQQVFENGEVLSVSGWGTVWMTVVSKSIGTEIKITGKDENRRLFDFIPYGEADADGRYEWIMKESPFSPDAEPTTQL